MKLYKWLIIMALLPFQACYDSKNITYFRDLSDTASIPPQIIRESFEAHIEVDDVVEIIVNSINPQATAIFNLGNTTPVMPGPSANKNLLGTNPISNSTPGGYLVNKDGFIDFPILGKISVRGLTINALKDTVTVRLEKYLQNPIVTVRLINYKITVLGEVNSPASYYLQSERVSVLDALGMAGDLTIFGKRENVLLIREENGQRNFVRLNLTSSKLFESPYFYLKQNDVVYVEPNKQKVASNDARTVRNISLVTSLITLLIIVLTTN